MPGQTDGEGRGPKGGGTDSAAPAQGSENTASVIEAMFRGLVEASFDAVVVSEERRVVDFNAKALELFGYDAAEMAGLDILELVVDDQREFVRDRIAAETSEPYDAVGRTKDGRSFPMEVSARTFRQGERRVRVAAIRDLTERYESEKVLRESEERYRGLAELLPDAVRVISEGHVVFANAAAARLLGAEAPDQLLGLPADHFVDPDEREEIHDRMARVDRGEYVPWREHRVHGIGGKTVTAESAMAPIVWDGKPSRLVVNRDTSRHKRVRDRLRRAMEEARQANVAKSRFLAAASHDLRQPIQAIGLLNAALAYEVTEPSQKELTSNMDHAIEAMRSVLDGLLDISRLEAGVVTPQFADFAIAPLLERIAGELSVEAAAKSLDLRVVPCGLSVHSDRDLLMRIVQNFASNAIRYTASGRVLIGCRRRGAELDVQVWDSGPGVPSSQREKIFEEFYQIENQARDRSKGLGLGLAIVERLGRLLGHSIEVRSEVGRGSMFSVTVPIATGVALGIPESETFPPIDLAGKWVLVLDDDPDVVRATESLLSRWGAQVLGAPTVDEALELASQPGRTPDLVIADYVLTDGENGIEAIHRLDEMIGRPVPRIVISGDVSSRIVSEVRDIGSALLHKPVNPAKLRALINHLLNPRRQDPPEHP